MLWKQKASTISVAEQQPEINREKTEPVSKVLEPVSKPENKDEGKEKNSAKEKPEDKDEAQLANKTEETKKTEPSINKESAKIGTGETSATAAVKVTLPAPVQVTATEKPVAPKAEAHNQSGHALTAEYYQPDKSVIIVDLYSELKKIRGQIDAKTKSITIKLPERGDIAPCLVESRVRTIVV